jgi:hypothetical protein
MKGTPSLLRHEMHYGAGFSGAGPVSIGALAALRGWPIPHSRHSPRLPRSPLARGQVPRGQASPGLATSLLGH